jgi:protein gp37
MTKPKKMNASGIDYLDYAWNPVTGCLHGCEYCWARKMAKRFYVKSYTTRYEKREHVDFKPTFHPDRLDWPKNTKKPGRVGVVFMGDLFGDWVPDEWIEQVFKACEAAPWHTYLFLTKNPKRYLHIDNAIFNKYSNWRFGLSATGEGVVESVVNSYLASPPTPLNFTSLEPFNEWSEFHQVHPATGWLIVGAQTQPLKLPEKEWVLDIRKQCKDLGIPLFEKKNLAKLDLPGGLIQEYPEGMNDNP